MSDKTIPITGGCMCGAIRYEAREHPTETGYCHCSRCQKASGNLFISYAVFPTDALKITCGKPKFFQSSPSLDRGFCSDCGTPVVHYYLKGNDIVIVMLGSMDHPEEWPPTMHVGVESQISWLSIHDNLPRLRSEDDPDIIAARESAD
jgi:adenylate cyclase